MLNIININLIGALYTVKVALHYFRRQHFLNDGAPLDQVLLVQGSLSGYLDMPGGVQYAASKYALRGIFRTLRLSEGTFGVRVIHVAPWFTETKILTDDVVAFLKTTSTEFSNVGDAAEVVIRIMSDVTISGSHLQN